MNKILMTHDLTCTISELGGAACRYANTGGGLETLTSAAVAFTIQLAIEAGRAPAEMRALEAALHAVLKKAP